jgi:nucleoside-diphosphate-sugar epimerase
MLTPDLPQRPQTPRGEIRRRVEQRFEAAAARGDIQAIILRAGDFFSPDCDGDWFEYVLLREAKKGRIATMGLPGVGHSWAYLPDLARAFESLAAMRSSLRAFENFHFAGHFVTGEEMSAAIAKAAPEPMRESRFPLWLLKIGGLFDPMLREVSKMDYIWRNPIELRDTRLDALLGSGFNTPFDDAVAATVTRFFPREVPLSEPNLNASLTRA